jgi:hypothetical protein
MSQPPYPYNRIFDFESFSIVNPTTQQPGVQVEGELDNVKRTLDSLISRLSEIQRDDGYIRDSALDQSTAIPQFYDRLVLLFGPAFALKAPIASPTFTGVVTIPANAVIVGFAKLESPDFTGVPTAPTPATLSASQQIANAAFVTAADAAIKQFVIDNYLKLDGDQMNDDSVIYWTKSVAAARAVIPPLGSVDTVTNNIDKSGVNLVGNYSIESTGAYQPSFTNKRETFISQGKIELKELNAPGLGSDADNWTLKGKIVIWSGESYQGSTEPLPILNPLSGPHITLWDRALTYGGYPMMISSNGLQFPDGTNQETRGLSIGEVQAEAQYAADLAFTTIVNGAPAALDTLKEIADALGNDADLAGTLANSIATKADIVHSHVTSDIIGLDAAIQSAQPNLADYATQSFVNAKPGLGNLAYSLNYSDPAVASHYDGLVSVYDAQAGFTSYNLTITSPTDVLVSSYAGYTVAFVAQAGSSNVAYDHVNKTVVFEVNTMAGSGNMQDAFSALNGNGSGWTFGGELVTAYYVSQDELFGQSFLMYGQTFTIGATDRFANVKNLWNDITTSVNALNLSNKLVGTDSAGKVKFHELSSLASVSGVTFTGKVNTTATATTAALNIAPQATPPNSTVAGDVWIGTNLNYKSFDGTTKSVANTNTANTFTAFQVVNVTSPIPALRINQKGTGNSLLVEDAITPDTSAFVIDANGNVGVGVATGYASTAKVEVVGNVKATTFSNGTGPTFSVTSTSSHTGGSHTLDLLVNINGSSYRIGLRPA